MSKRRSTPFRRAGEIGGKALGLSSRQADHLRIVGAWNRAAGAALAQQVPVSEWLRGTLTLEASDVYWGDAIRPLLEELLAGLAAELHPRIAIKRFRLRVPGQAELSGEVSLAESAEDESVRQPTDAAARVTAALVRELRSRRSRRESTPLSAEERAARLRRLRDRYLEAARRGSHQGS